MDDDSHIEAIHVSVRIRPLNERELNEQQVIDWEYNDTTLLETTFTGKKIYEFDHVLAPEVTNEQVYAAVARRVVMKALTGYNATVFTYGQVIEPCATIAPLHVGDVGCCSCKCCCCSCCHCLSRFWCYERFVCNNYHEIVMK